MSSSRVVVGAAGASVVAVGVATGAGAEVAATGAGAAAALRPAFLVSVAAGATGAATTGTAGETTGATGAAGASSVFLATRLALGAEEAAAEFIIPVPLEEFISIKRTMPSPMARLQINFYQKSLNFGTRAHI